MIDRILIIRGVSSADEIAPLGLEVAERYREADKIFIIDKIGMPKQIKYRSGEEISRLYYIDADLVREVLNEENGV